MLNRGGTLGGVLLALAVAMTASAQNVAPRLTGAMVVAHLDKVEQAVKEQASASHDAQLSMIAEQLQHLRTGLSGSLGDTAGAPLATVSARTRDAAMRADAAARQVQTWLDTSAEGCAHDAARAMATAVKVTLDRLVADTSSQKAPLPVIDGVETLDQRPLFVLRQGVAAPRFVLTGANLVDPQCANPEVVALRANGKAVGAQPQLIAAQPGRVELQWPGATDLAPGSYVLQLTAQRKAFLVGCTSEPPAVAVLQVAPPLQYTVSYTLSATCSGATQPTVLGSGTLPPLTTKVHMATQRINASACAGPSSYTVVAAVRASGGQETRYGPVTQSATAIITTGLGNGLTLTWNPFLQQLLVTAGGRTCKGVY